MSKINLVNTLLLSAILLSASSVNATDIIKDFWEMLEPGIGKARECRQTTNCQQTHNCTPTRSCEQTENCAQTNDCRQTENCRRCLVKNPFGGCSIRGNDPGCELRKTGRKADCERLKATRKAQCEAGKVARKADCERLKTQEKGQCEAEKKVAHDACEVDKTANKMDCERLKSSQIATSEITEASIHESKKQMNRRKLDTIPQYIRSSLKSFFPENVLDGVRYTSDYTNVLSLSKYALDWAGKDAIVFGHIIVFKNLSDALTNVGLWAHELEHVKQYERLGIDGFSQYYTHASNRIEAAAEAQANYVCSKISDC